MNTEPVSPKRPLSWPEVVHRIASATSAASQLYLVGGSVRDALLDRPIHDIDLVTPADGLTVARRLADALGGAYYAVDRERHTGRVILEHAGRRILIDVASFRGSDLLDDLVGRDFTINAMAVRLDQLDLVIDPLASQRDLFGARLLRQCAPDSIRRDPIRALRAVRQSLQFQLRMEPETREAARGAAPQLVDETGILVQPERIRDELFKMLGGTRPAAALRLLYPLGLLAAIWPANLPSASVIEPRFSVVQRLHDLLAVISPRRNDNTAAAVMLGVAVMALDRHRRQLQDQFAQVLADERTRGQLLLLSALTPPEQRLAALWTERLRLSKIERRLLADLEESRTINWLPSGWVDDRQIFRYYRLLGESGVDAVILALGEYLCWDNPPPDPDTWGRFLDEVASPLLDGFFRRHQEVVAPPPLINGDDLQQLLGLKAGPQVGKTLDLLLEEQAAGTIRTKKEALQRAKRLATQDKS